MNQQQSIEYRFGRAVRRRRRELDLSQEELAERSGLHRNYISSVENGNRNPSLRNVEKLAQALDISISDLFVNYNIEVKQKDPGDDSQRELN
ncbi:helix-turn-helix transcriptional regulator [Limnoraphis robusta Tam1]|uniref:helix-turn-helix domain-containing protein n=1 Tax=Limnoraphis robusta TaxID=1118279 RepID=UPI002B1F7BE6|nr:helix-turn-helix transcriptional regulator [Limnoraphis robusta]MEA5499196.1 helix-turn-helix transcriptional regulator [Limnoraphis robusta BA-68 BA1]MEA5540683.1 helix-turn-helix transcriptional regulator [Limnoraphis robusta Tam1]